MRKEEKKSQQLDQPNIHALCFFEYVTICMCVGVGGACCKIETHLLSMNVE